MSVVPTRALSKNAPKEWMTLDQFEHFHGKQPVKKVIPPRPLGPPKARDEVIQNRDKPVAIVSHQPPSQNPTSTVPTFGQFTATAAAPLQLAPEPPIPTPARPKARLIRPDAVSPTDPNYQGSWTAQPCGNVVELVVEIEEGTIVYPVACETLGDHPNQPHMARVPGQPADGRPHPTFDIFLGWGDV